MYCLGSDGDDIDFQAQVPSPPPSNPNPGAGVGTNPSYGVDPNYGSNPAAVCSKGLSSILRTRVFISSYRDHRHHHHQTLR